MYFLTFFTTMEKTTIILCFVMLFFTLSQGKHLAAKPKPKPRPQITVMGTVYCDICSNNSFSRHSYFLPGVEVKIECKLKATGPRTAEEVRFTVNRTTNENGWYKLEIPAVDGIECARGAAVASVCRASLVGSSTAKCNVPGFKTTTDAVFFKSSQLNVCIYGLSALNFRPSRKNKALCEIYMLSNEHPTFTCFRISAKGGNIKVVFNDRKRTAMAYGYSGDTIIYEPCDV